MRRAVGWILLLCCALPAQAALADVRLDVRTDRTEMSLDDTLVLQIRVEAEGAGSPRVDIPKFDGFQIVSQQVQRPMQFSFSFGSNAVMQSSTIHTFMLRPVRDGTLVIKPVRTEFEGQVQTSRPIQIVVSSGAQGQHRADAPADAQQPAAAAKPDRGGAGEVDDIAFVRTVADKTEPYEGEQVTVTIYVYTRERLQALPDVQTEPTTDGFWIQDLLGPNQQFRGERTMVGNNVYAVYVLRRFAAFPLHSGDVTIGPMALEIDTSSAFDFFPSGRGRSSVKRSSKPLTLKVKPLPAEGRPAGEIAVGRYQVNAKLDRAQVVTGDAVTLTAVVEGQGNVRTVQLQPPVLAGFDVLQPEIKDLVEAPRDVVGGRREYRWLLLSHAPGRVSLPGLSLSTFDPRSGHYETRTSQPLTLEAVGQARAPDARTPRPEQAAEQPETSERHEWAPIRTQSALRRGERSVAERAWYPWALGAPLLIWLGVVSATWLRRRLGGREQSAQMRAMRGAQERLHAAQRAAAEGDATRYHAHASAALLGALDARLAEAVGGLTRPQLRALLQARGMEPGLIDAITQTLQDCEFARFGSMPLSSAELGAQAQALEACFQQLTSWKPLTSGHATEAA